MYEIPPAPSERIKTFEEATIGTSNRLENSAELALSRRHLLFKDGNFQPLANVVDTMQLLCQIVSSCAEHLQNEYVWTITITFNKHQAAETNGTHRLTLSKAL